MTKAEKAEVARILADARSGRVNLRELFRKIRKNPKSALFHRLRLDPEFCIEQTNVRILRDVFEAYRVEVKLETPDGALVCSVPGAVSIGKGYCATERVMESVEMSAEQLREEWKRRDAIDARIIALASVLPEFEHVRDCIARQRAEFRLTMNGAVLEKGKVA